MIVAGLLIWDGRVRPSGLVAIAASLTMLLGVSSAAHGRWRTYVAQLADGVGDVLLLVPMAWPLRYGARPGAAVIAALGCVFCAAYAETKAAALSYQVAAVPAGAPERAFVLGVAMLVPRSLEWVLFGMAALMLVSAGTIVVTVWRRA